MADNYIISLDQGTTSSRTIIFNTQGDVISSSQKEFKQIFPKPGWVEHDPEEIWNSQYATLSESLKKSNLDPKLIKGIGITNQRETTIIWDKISGKPIYNAIVWQDRRTADICEELKKVGLEEYIKENTGLVIDAYFSGTKIKWLLDNVPGARAKAEKGELLFGTVDTWLLWKMTKGRVHATDYTNASRTLIYNINTLEWDTFLLEKLNIPIIMLPSVHPSSHIFGSWEFNGQNIPIAGIAGDQQAALFGQMCFEPGMAKNTYGTGCFMLMNTGNKKISSNLGL